MGFLQSCRCDKFNEIRFQSNFQIFLKLFLILRAFSKNENIIINNGGAKKKDVRKQQAISRLKVAEKQKDNWLNFKQKYSKKIKGRVSNKSIFQSPETGHIGRGTGSTAGKPMTENCQKERNRYY